MKFKYFLILLFVNIQMFSQTENDREIYLDSLKNETNKEDYVFYRLIKDYNQEKELYAFKDFFKSNEIQMKGNSNSKEYLNQEGEFTFYFKNGNIQSIKNFVKSKTIGKISSWYENGNKRLEGEFFENITTKEPQFNIYNFWDKNQTKIIENGNGNFEDDEISEYSKGTYRNGLKEGFWEGNDKIFKFSFKENYENGKLISGISIDLNKKEHNYNAVIELPKPKKGIDDFYKYIGKKYNVPKSLKEKQRIILGFYIDIDGEISELKIISGQNEETNKEALRVVNNYRDWIPGKYRGIKTKVSYTIPLSILPCPNCN